MKKLWPFLLLLLCGCPKRVSAQVPVTLSPVANQQFFGANGAPLANGCLFTYQSGTGTPAATYTDQSGLYQAPNPIILDGGGFASIWLSAQSYRFVLFSTGGVNCASGTQQWLIDGVNPPPFLAGNNVWTGTQTFTGTANFNGALNANAGGTLIGSFGGNPNFTGTPTFAGTPSFTNGISVSYWQSQASSPAATGVGRLSTGDSICWRNAANTADLCLSKDGSDIFSIGTGIFGFTNTINTWALAQTFTAIPIFSSNINIAGIIDNYNGAATTGDGIPSIRNSGTIHSGKTADDSNILTYTAPVTGLYRITIVESVTTAASSTSTLPTPQIAFTDSFSGAAVSAVAFESTNANDLSANTPGTQFTGTVSVWALASTNIVVSNAGYASSGGTMMAYSDNAQIEAQ